MGSLEALNVSPGCLMSRRTLQHSTTGGIDRYNSRSDIEYCTAIGTVKAAATLAAARRNVSVHHTIEERALCETVGRFSAQDYCAPFATPPADTSAMDGFAISSSATRSACQEKPIHFSVRGSMFAGAANAIELPCVPEADIWPCVEIATGARFPTATQSQELEQRGNSFDAVVPYESVKMVHCNESGERRVLIDQPVRPYQHRRFAGEDIQEGTVILPANTLIQPQHIMALASLGVPKVAIQRRPKVGIWSTGNEVVGMDEIGNSGTPPSQERHRIFDANGPFLISLLTSMGVEVEYLGSSKDRKDDFKERLENALNEGRYDLLLSTGAVSAGKQDFVRAALEEISANVVFHGARIRPGHPLLFAELGRPGRLPERAHAIDEQLAPIDAEVNHACDHRRVGFFGLPGNPLAAAVGFRFFVVPYLRTLQGLVDEQPKLVTIRASPENSPAAARTGGQRAKPKDKDVFWHGTVRELKDGPEFMLSSDQSPSKIKGFSRSSGWIHIPSGYSEVRDGDRFPHYPILPV